MMMEAGNCGADKPDGGNAEADQEAVQVSTAVLGVSKEPVLEEEPKLQGREENQSSFVPTTELACLMSLSSLFAYSHPSIPLHKRVCWQPQTGKSSVEGSQSSKEVQSGQCCMSSTACYAVTVLSIYSW